MALCINLYIKTLGEITNNTQSPGKQIINKAESISFTVHTK